MSDLFTGFVRKQFDVEAVRITPLNIREVAKACGGSLRKDGDKEGNFSRHYIKVRVFLPLNDDQTKARVGDWLVRQGRTFKVYKDGAFRKTFENKDGSEVDTEKVSEEKPLDQQVFDAKNEKTIPEDRIAELDKAQFVENKPKPITLDQLNKHPH